MKIKQTREVMNAGYLIAKAWKQANVDVVAAYPITPNTITVEKFSEYKARKSTHAQYINTESEYSSLAAVIGASAAGARAATCTSANGLAFMFECINIASGLRLPCIMGVQSRTLSAPLDIHCDHSDWLCLDSSGWLMSAGEDAQDSYDMHILSFKISEHPDDFN